jgi:hypothetical protein
MSLKPRGLEPIPEETRLLVHRLCPKGTLVTVLQAIEGLTDRQAAEAVRTRIDWLYALALPLDEPGFDYSILCNSGLGARTRPQ